MGDIIAYFNQYGYLVLLVSLILEMIAFPLPGEVILSYCGFLVYQGQLNWILSILMAWLGVSIGVTISYWIGYKLGTPFLVKYGKFLLLRPARVKKTSVWFGKYGKKLLVIAYFLPGIRHVTGYFSGITRLPFIKFAMLAYSGALIWVSVFICTGELLGPKWKTFSSIIKPYLISGGSIALLMIVMIVIYKKYRVQITKKAFWIIQILFHKSNNPK
ncbi:DedA family protein [Rummeliibacillus pycnus]|uniref:DedA family protein n=1 Tax=Rummeliibacillus pycnus TaxID=101070 RepID=UPI001B80441F|nr:DedA family protein [Rummeliibacillus pycnus]